MWLELWQNYGMSYKKNTEVEVLPVVDLFKESAKKNSFSFVGGATRGQAVVTGVVLSPPPI